jgi:hypothetical protein
MADREELPDGIDLRRALDGRYAALATEGGSSPYERGGVRVLSLTIEGTR